MTSPAVTFPPDPTVEEAARLMQRKHVSRLPVMARSRCAGLRKAAAGAGLGEGAFDPSNDRQRGSKAPS
ncbi:CBS domain-containing protein [Actinomadura fibrosa]|uniref:CBS domain-containing protein n=1 Tax=Actinomadura fibrosa TaxID=111802 RepID=A0ABW2XT60_9ACTN|nr:CBS domain-containing protein [Actinomadura fibrosa]